MAVSRAKLEERIAQLRDEVRDPRAGIYGPGSVAWRVDREIVVFLGGGRAALLQMAHPFVSRAIEQHSDAKENPLGRFQRTFDAVFAMVFAPLEDAIAAARRVHGVHQRIAGRFDQSLGGYHAGDAYLANDEDALMWVHGTLIDSAVQAYELVLGPLSERDRQRYYTESRRFAMLFGIPDEVIPSDWHAFERYNRRMWAELEVGAWARTMADALLSPPALRPPRLARWYRAVTAHLLPEPVRRGYRMDLSRRERITVGASLTGLRRSYRAWPTVLREVPAYRDALRRLAGKQGRDPVSRTLERALVQALLGGGSGASASS